MQIHVNGETRDLPAGSTVRDLLATLGLNPKTVAVLRNDDIVPCDEQAQTPLVEGDTLEIVRFVGGG
jgi:thiamine biosynthesis protein ThiS